MAGGGEDGDPESQHMALEAGAHSRDGCGILATSLKSRVMGKSLTWRLAAGRDHDVTF